MISFRLTLPIRPPLLIDYANMNPCALYKMERSETPFKRSVRVEVRIPTEVLLSLAEQRAQRIAARIAPDDNLFEKLAISEEDYHALVGFSEDEMALKSGILSASNALSVSFAAYRTSVRLFTEPADGGKRRWQIDCQLGEEPIAEPVVKPIEFNLSAPYDMEHSLDAKERADGVINPLRPKQAVSVFFAEAPASLTRRDLPTLYDILLDYFLTAIVAEHFATLPAALRKELPELTSPIGLLAALRTMFQRGAMDLPNVKITPLGF